MNSAEHKRSAEAWIKHAQKVVGTKNTQTCLMYAQTHALLALVNDKENNEN